mgnify:CR=1 FL=1
MKITKKELEELQKILEEILSSEDFCSCYEGDIDGIFWKGIEKVIKIIELYSKGERNIEKIRELLSENLRGKKEETLL